MEKWTISEPQRLDMTEPVTQLDVSLTSARVNVVGTDGPARLEVTKASRKPLIVEQNDEGVLRLRQEKRPWWTCLLWSTSRDYHTEVSLAVPQATASKLRVTSGSVVASTLHADTRVAVTSGRVTLLGLDGRVTAKVTSGSIEALGVGGELDVESTSGEISLAESTAGRVHAKAVSGSLTCDLDNPQGSDIHLETVSGEIKVRVREDSDLDVDLHATSGRISTAFPQLSELGRPGHNSARGRLGAGTGRLSARAISGNIALLARPVDSEEPPVDAGDRSMAIKETSVDTGERS